MKSEIPEETTLKSLENYRKSIDRLDAILVFTLAERFKLTENVGKLKVSNSLPPADFARENKQLKRLERLSLEAGIDPVFAKKFLKFIITEVKRHHEEFQRLSNE